MPSPFWKSAQAKENCVPDVAQTLANVHERIEENNREEKNLLARAEEQREFLLSFAEGLLSPTPTNLHGLWKFAETGIDLRYAAPVLSGTTRTRTPVTPDLGLSALFPGAAPKSVMRVESFEFSGTVSGRVCKFELVTSRQDEPSSWTFGGLAGSSTLEGYIVFSEDGSKGVVAELKDEKLHNFYEISKLTGHAKVS